MELHPNPYLYNVLTKSLTFHTKTHILPPNMADDERLKGPSGQEAQGVAKPAEPQQMPDGTPLLSDEELSALAKRLGIPQELYTGNEQITAEQTELVIEKLAKPFMTSFDKAEADPAEHQLLEVDGLHSGHTSRNLKREVNGRKMEYLAIVNNDESGNRRGLSISILPSHFLRGRGQPHATVILGTTLHDESPNSILFMNSDQNPFRQRSTTGVVRYALNMFAAVERAAAQPAPGR